MNDENPVCINRPGFCIFGCIKLVTNNAHVVTKNLHRNTCNSYSEKNRAEYNAGGRRNMDERLTTKELDRLTGWLTAQGLPPEKVLECIKYIAGESAPAKE